jgi:transcriptional regulator with XRE-family HTH domain
VSDDLYRKIGAAIRQARDAKGMSQSQVAERIGMARASVANLEAGRQGIPFPTLAAVVQVLGIDLAPLIALVELPPVPHQVTMQSAVEVTCLTCGGAPLGFAGSRDAAEKMKAEHIASQDGQQ